MDFDKHNNEVKEMLTQQGNVCAICGSGNIPLQVDHSHSSGKVRGMLCAKCNRGLGLFYDNQKFLRKAREYLIRWNDKTTRIGGLL